MDTQSVKDELTPLISLEDGGSYNQVMEMLNTISILKYVQHRHLLKFDRFRKVRSKKKLQALCELKYLERIHDDVYIATKKTYEALPFFGYKTSLLPNVTGKGGVEALRNTDVFIELMKEVHFFTLLYPRFPKEIPWLVPDALMVLFDGNRYKLQFIEVEHSKPEWEEYIRKKRDNYLRLASEELPLAYWRTVARKLGFPVPSKSSFCFSVLIVGEFRPDWKEDGFEFR